MGLFKRKKKKRKGYNPPPEKSVRPDKPAPPRKIYP